MKDPHEVVKAGDIVTVRVKDVDVARKRIALTMKSVAGAGAGESARTPKAPPADPRHMSGVRESRDSNDSPFAALKGMLRE